MKATETIFSGKSLVVPMADVLFIEKHFTAEYKQLDSITGNTKLIPENFDGCMAILQNTKWNFQYDTWENAVWISNYEQQATKFIKAWCDYRAEIDGMVEVNKDA